MKTKLWMLGMAVAALTSCTQSEVVEMPESRVIKFESHVDKSARAVSELSASTLERFYVFGYHTPYTVSNESYIFDFSTTKETIWENVPVNEPTTGTSWSPTTDGYWSAGHMYNFAAYSNGNSQINSGVSYNPQTDQVEFTGYSVIDASTTSSTQPDLIAAISSSRTGESGATPVDLIFRHMLTKVSLNLINTSSNSTLHFDDFRINNIHKEGTCNYNFNVNHTITWTPTDVASEFSYGSAVVPARTGQVNTHVTIDFYMIPQTIAEGTYLKFTLTEKVNDQPVVSTAYKALITGASTGDNPNVAENSARSISQWEPGYHYNYIITHGQEFQKITFTPTINDWAKDVNHDNYSDGYDGINLTIERDNAQSGGSN